MSEDPLKTITEKYSKCANLPNLSCLADAVVHGFDKFRIVAEILPVTTQSSQLSRIYDMLTALYVPETLTYFEVVCNNMTCIAKWKAPLPPLKVMLEEARSIPKFHEVPIFTEKFHSISQKIIYIQGKPYRRISVGSVDVPLVSMAFAILSIFTTEENCRIFGEFYQLDTEERHAITRPKTPLKLSLFGCDQRITGGAIHPNFFPRGYCDDSLFNFKKPLAFKPYKKEIGQLIVYERPET